jgi:hypothetical protein
MPPPQIVVDHNCPLEAQVEALTQLNKLNCLQREALSGMMGEIKWTESS